MTNFFEGLDKSELPDNEGRAIKWCNYAQITALTWIHDTTTMNGKLGGAERAITIDEVPFEWCF